MLHWLLNKGDPRAERSIICELRIAVWAHEGLWITENIAEDIAKVADVMFMFHLTSMCKHLRLSYGASEFSSAKLLI